MALNGLPPRNLEVVPAQGSISVSAHPVPVLLHACRISRHLARKQYKRCFDNKQCRRVIYSNFDKDRLIFPEFLSMKFLWRVGPTADNTILLSEDSIVLLENLQHIVFASDVEDFAQVFRHFRILRTLCFGPKCVFICGYSVHDGFVDMYNQQLNCARPQNY